LKSIILANVRTGSTFLTEALDSHPDMHWRHGEPLPRKLKGDPECYDVLGAYYERHHDSVVGCKVTYYHLRADWGLLEYLKSREVSAIHLVRGNPLRWILSVKISAKTKGRPGHTDKTLPIARVKVNPQDMLNKARICIHIQNQARERLVRSGLRHIEMTYEEMTGGREAVAGPTKASTKCMCDFLGVPYHELESSRRGVNRYPMSEIITNWNEVESVLLSSEFDYLVREEESWKLST